MADVPETTSPPQPSDDETRPQREKHPTYKALQNQITTAEKELRQQWGKTSLILEKLNEHTDDQAIVLHDVTDARSALHFYNESWAKLAQLYKEDQTGELKDEARDAKTTYLENTTHANDIISQGTERLYQLALETQSGLSRRTRSSHRSTASSSRSQRAKALATAAAAAQSAAFEEAIAKRTADMKVLQMTNDAERQIEQLRQEVEYNTKQAAVEADIQILRARQTAAVERARSDALIRAEQDESCGQLLTSPEQTSNDHALHHSVKTGNDAPSPVLNGLRAAAPVFQPVSHTTYAPIPINVEQSTPQPAETLINLTKEISNTLARQRQPSHEPDVYGGDPMIFRPWRSSFETMVNQAETPATQKLAFLTKYTKGQVKQLVDRFRHRYVSDPDTAYEEAWKELEHRFGNKSQITAEIIKKLSCFPRFRQDERHRLQELADLCVDTAAQMNDLHGLGVLNYPHNLQPILEKLPTFIHNSWRKKVTSHKANHDIYPPFGVFAQFINERARSHNDPDLYPSTMDSQQPKKADTFPPRKSPLRIMATKGSTVELQSPNTKRCLFHEHAGHDISECIAFSRKPLTERRDFCRKKGLCFKCGKNHRIKDCDSSVECKKCNSAAHALFMHVPARQDGGENKTEESTLQKEAPQTQANLKCTRYSDCSMARSCSKIVLVKLYHQDNPSSFIHTYAVLDDQSNACLGDPKIFEALDIHGHPFEYELSTCSGRGILTQGRRGQGLIMESMTGHKEQLPTVLENENIPGDRNEIPSPDLCKKFPHLVPIADKIPKPRDDTSIFLLIGRNCPEPLKVRESRNGPRGTPWAQRTDLGWTISGQMCISEIKGQIRTSVNRTIIQEQLDNPVTCDNHIYVKDLPSSARQGDDTCKIYQETADDYAKALSVEDEHFLRILKEGAHTNLTGNLEFPLPFKKDDTRVPNNRSQAQGRLNNLLKVLRRTPTMMSEYQTFFGKILSRNHASPVQQEYLKAIPGKVWYLPHFAVRHPKKKDIRVVFDASAEFDGLSLNKVLLQGPDQMNSLLGILLRFRIGQVAVMGDVEQMFHSFHVNPEHRDYIRFLWFQDNDPTKPIIDYKMNVHLFGSISSPAVATFGLRMAADAGKDEYGDDVAEFVYRDFYVDDGLTSLQDVESAVSLIKRTCDTLAAKGLRFHKVASNNKDVMNALPDGTIAKDLASLNLDCDELPTQRSLGIQWSLEEDALFFHAELPDKPFSRRGVLSIASSIFDPQGLVAPVTIEGKIILREVMTEMKGKEMTRDAWDRPLPEAFLPKWSRWRNSLLDLEPIKIQRCYHPPDFGEIKRHEIHIFSDASEQAIGAAVYLRLLNVNGQPHVSLVLAKAKVTPMHAVSIPRLELCAAVLATTLARKVDVELRGRMVIDSTTFYTDSKIVLSYIANESKRFHVYVANRVHKIHSVSHSTQWNHVSTDQNPADHASRGVPAHQLKNTSWFRGPEFLWKTEITPLQTTVAIDASLPPLLKEDDPEVRKQVLVSTTEVKNEETELKQDESRLGSDRFSKFSRWQTLKRAVATLIRKVKNVKSRHRDQTPGKRRDYSEADRRPKTEDLNHAEQLIFRTVQRDYFSEELKSLKAGQTVKKQSPLYKLNPFVDSSGIIRVGGRLRRADLDLGGRHPTLLPKSSHIAKLIVEHFHREIVQHQGRQFTASAIRSGGTWIIGAHQLVRSIIHACTICRKLRGQPLNQVMADLPRDRLEATPPFTNVGMDVFGHWLITTRKTRGGSADSKRWAVLFTCLYTRAIHVEIIEAMDASAFISAFRRFTAVRGPVARLRCDRGTNFVGAKSELKMTPDEMNHVAEYLSSHGCEWVFNPPHASHFGGIWERQIGIIRRVLDAMFLQLGKHQLTHEILTTFMAEACAIVNSRPITSVSSDANDPQALTPAMLLTTKMQPLHAPPGDFVKEDLFARKRWRRVQYLANQFWIRWRREYLQSLQPRQKWSEAQPNLAEGDVVLVREKESPRCNWPLARVAKTYDSDDGKVRKADVTFRRNGTQRTALRPITELILIESPARA